MRRISEIEEQETENAKGYDKKNSNTNTGERGGGHAVLTKFQVVIRLRKKEN